MNLLLPRNSTDYVVARTDTFRLASRMITVKLTHPARDGKVGSNLQNVEGHLRRIYISDGWNPEDNDECFKLAYYLEKGDLSIFSEEQLRRIKILIQIDQAGAEALIVAYLCRHGNFRELFLNNIKSHVYVALHVFADVWKQEMEQSGTDIKCDIDALLNCEIKDIPSYPFWRQLDKLIKSSDKWPSERRYYYIAKQICHSSNYGIKAGMFQLNTLEKSKGRIVIAKKDAERYLATYHGLFGEIHEWHHIVERQISEFRVLYNLFGYPRYFWYPSLEMDEYHLKSALAFIPQSTVGTITNIAFTMLQKKIEQEHLPWDLLANTHDSYMCQCPIGQEKECARVMMDIINMPFKAPSDGVLFNMKSEASYGFNWAKNDEKTNQLGLVELN